MADLKLIALDADDLVVLSAHLQDAVVRVADMTFLKPERRFAAIANRFDWENLDAAGRASRDAFVRRRAGLRFERVIRAEVKGLDPRKGDSVLSLLALTFEPAELPAGVVTLAFSGGAAIRLHVECIEAELKDLGAAWTTGNRPEHAGDEPAK